MSVGSGDAVACREPAANSARCGDPVATGGSTITGHAAPDCGGVGSGEDEPSAGVGSSDSSESVAVSFASQRWPSDHEFSPAAAAVAAAPAAAAAATAAAAAAPAAAPAAADPSSGASMGRGGAYITMVLRQARSAECPEHPRAA